MVVLGLATSHHGKWHERMKQVRHGDRPWYPHVLWSLRWTIAHSKWMVPLQFDTSYHPKPGKFPQKEVLHLFRWFTHTHTPFISLGMGAWEWGSCHWGPHGWYNGWYIHTSKAFCSQVGVQTNKHDWFGSCTSTSMVWHGAPAGYADCLGCPPCGPAGHESGTARGWATVEVNWYHHPTSNTPMGTDHR